MADLLPREHGAYAELLLPLAAVLAGAGASVASVSLALAACAAFVAHEPLLVLLGHRGTRARREITPRAWRWLAAATLLSVGLAAITFTLAPPARVWMGLPLALAAVVGVFILMRRERTLAGEVLACAALGSAAVPTAISAGADARGALAVWAVFTATSVLSTTEVRAIARREANLAARIVIGAGAVAVLVAIAAFEARIAIAALPVVLTIAAITVARPKPTKLRKIGWALASASLVMAIGVAVAVRLSSVS